MNLLLDTHAFLWWCANDSSLSQRALDAIADANNDVYLSSVSGWEIAIKSRLGKLPLAVKPDVFMANMLKQHAFKVLPITMSHALAEYSLVTHHSDPFDRLLIVQAHLEGLTLITNDQHIAKYPVEILW